VFEDFPGGQMSREETNDQLDRFLEDYFDGLTREVYQASLLPQKASSYLVLSRTPRLHAIVLSNPTFVTTCRTS
jgi:hypothetical protein